MKHNAIGLTDEEKKLFLKKSNSIGNICLLKPADNNSKRAEDLAVWLNEQVESVKENMLIPCDISYSFSDFINFVDYVKYPIFLLAYVNNIHYHFIFSINQRV